MNANACPLYTGTIAQGQGWHDTLTYSHPSGKGRCVHCAQPFSLHFNAEATEATCPDCQGTGLICPSPAVEEPCARCSGRGFLLNEEATEAVAKPVPPKYYIASKTKHAEFWRANRAGDNNVTSTWIDEAGEGETADYSELASRCLAEIQAADFLILYCEKGEVLKGALIEAGMALALGKPVRCVGDCESISRVFKEHPLWSSHPSILDAVAQQIRTAQPTPSGPTAGDIMDVRDPNYDDELKAARVERDRLKEANAILQSQVDNADLNFEQIRMIERGKTREIQAKLHAAETKAGAMEEALRVADAALQKLSVVLANQPCRDDGITRQQACRQACLASDRITAALPPAPSVASEKEGKRSTCGGTGEVAGDKAWLPCPVCATQEEPTLLPFDLAKALAGVKVVTRDGREVTELQRAGSDSSILKGRLGLLALYCGLDGRFCTNEESPFDLFLAPTP